MRRRLDHDDRIVNQQTQRNDERAQRNALQVDAQIQHAQERHRQHQRDAQRDHDAGRQPSDRKLTPAR
jgi:hypothetical protein